MKNIRELKVTKQGLSLQQAIKECIKENKELSQNLNFVGTISSEFTLNTIVEDFGRKLTKTNIMLRITLNHVRKYYIVNRKTLDILVEFDKHSSSCVGEILATITADGIEIEIGLKLDQLTPEMFSFEKVNINKLMFDKSSIEED